MRWDRDFCDVDGCRNETTRKSRYCERHARQYYRTGTPHLSMLKGHDWVGQRVGMQCLICGRHLSEHAVAESCESMLAYR